MTIRCLLMVLCLAFGVRAAQAGEITIASFNLEHLAEHNGEGCRARADADYEALRDFVAAMNVDVIAFSEVENEVAAARVFPPSEYAIVMEDRQDNGGGTCQGDTAHSLKRQAVGFAIKNELTFTRNPDYRALSLGNPRLRRGVDVTITAPVRLRLLAVHLKSGCFGANNSSDPDCPVLAQQRPVLERWIDRRANGNTPFVVLGDFNHHLARTNDWFWSAIDDGHPANANLRRAAEEDAPTCDPQFTRFIDHIVLDRRAGQRLVADSFLEHTYTGEHLSDHCAISAKLSWP